MKRESVIREVTHTPRKLPMSHWAAKFETTIGIKVGVWTRRAIATGEA